MTKIELHPLTEAFCEELVSRGRARLARVLLDMAERMAFTVALVDSPVYPPVLWIGSGCPTLNDEERGRLFSALNPSGCDEWLNLSLHEACGCGQHKDAVPHRITRLEIAPA